LGKPNHPLAMRAREVWGALEAVGGRRLRMFAQEECEVLNAVGGGR
jgi:hypothetical protein